MNTTPHGPAPRSMNASEVRQLPTTTAPAPRLSKRAKWGGIIGAAAVLVALGSIIGGHSGATTATTTVPTSIPSVKVTVPAVPTTTTDAQEDKTFTTALGATGNGAQSVAAYRTYAKGYCSNVSTSDADEVFTTFEEEAATAGVSSDTWDDVAVAGATAYCPTFLAETKNLVVEHN